MATDLWIYRDPAQPIHRRVEDLLSRMTLAEKIGQLNMPIPWPPGASEELGRPMPCTPEDCEQLAVGAYTGDIGPVGCFFGLGEHVRLSMGVREQTALANRLQALAVEETRLGIPLLMTEEGTHGAMVPGATIFPEGAALGSAWDVGLVQAVYAAAAAEARAMGIHQLCTLVVEPNRDPRLGRNCEGYSEDPYFCARYAQAIVAGTQGDDISAADRVIAALCHFPGQSQPASGLERGAMEISERMLREVFLPPWVAGIKQAGAGNSDYLCPGLRGRRRGPERLCRGRAGRPAGRYRARGRRRETGRDGAGRQRRPGDRG